MNRRMLFYHQNAVKLEVEGSRSWVLFRAITQPLAELQNTAETRLYIADGQGSVQQYPGGGPHGYTAYGYDIRQRSLTKLGFNGERREPSTEYYLLGQGYRAYNPALMRFQAPDSLSPFGEAGINSYAYCLGDPINNADPSGHISAIQLQAARNAFTPPSRNASRPSVASPRSRLAKKEQPLVKRSLAAVVHAYESPQETLQLTRRTNRQPYVPGQPILKSSAEPAAKPSAEHFGKSVYLQRKQFYHQHAQLVEAVRTQQQNFYRAAAHLDHKGMDFSKGIKAIREAELVNLAQRYAAGLAALNNYLKNN
ncbi:RHS repeat-associated core domain-containing protein [Pseudomonas putida]|uniref:RHS repeat-associated core domain-containing protein n=1 Tax=Pseudomonas putida TaxID=303 RepID=A0A4D6XB21_PSEPU|nr:RHS repeat-associated core domain-containing protein [Pseudomonas putida]QCI11380.1 RHS repeat-associated core domain-containing protein [Pseudomonas putida]